MYDAEPSRKPPLDATLRKLHNYANETNIADKLKDDQLDEIGAQVCEDYEIDKASREDWEKTATKALDAALQKREAKNFPFENSSNVKYPLITVAALQFNARAYPAIVADQNIVKGVPLGKDEQGEKQNRADRIGRHMSYQLLYQMKEWEEDTDVLLNHLPIVGCCFRKVWRDGKLGRNRVQMRPALKVIVNNAVESMEDAQRITDEIELYPQDIEERIRNGEFREIELQPAEENDKDAPHEFLEQHRFWDLDSDGYREPYVVTVHKETRQVARIVANYKPDAIEHDGKKIIRIPRRDYFVKYPFLPDPKGGFYDVGFGQLLESLAGTIDTTINQMLDAGTLQNAGGGFIGSGLRTKKDQIRFKPGRYHYVETGGAQIRDAIYNMEHPGPSPVLFTLLELLLAATKDITGVKDILTGDTGGKVQAPTTVIAMVEQGLKVFTSIYKRVWRAMRQEFKLLFELNGEYMDDQEYFTLLDDNEAVAKADYDTTQFDVVPVADPRMVTDMQRAARSQALMEMYEILPNKQEALRRILEGVNEPNIDALLEVPEDPMQQMAQAIQVEDATAEIDKKQAAAAKDEAIAQKTLAEIEGDARKDQANVAKMIDDAEKGDRKLDLEEQALKQPKAADA